MILFLKQDDKLVISVINDIPVSERGHKGIPMGYENIVFEPFFRLSKVVYEDYKTLDYGLGLTLVEKIVTSCGGKIALGNINDYSDIKAGAKVKVECRLASTKKYSKRMSLPHAKKYSKIK
jgi:K+-sensing histidine kinase KdpD